MSPERPLIVWFDSRCPLCRREIDWLRRLDHAGRIRFLDAHDTAVECPVERIALLNRFHALENGALLSGAPAFAAMWRAIPLLRPLGLLAQVPCIEKLLEWAYLRFLRIRPRLQEWLG